MAAVGDLGRGFVGRFCEMPLLAEGV
jgi:hypothetical protein